MKKISLVVLLCAVSMNVAMAQRKVAILETIDKEGCIPYGIELALRASLATGVTNATGFEGYDRVDLESVFGEHDFQRTGLVTNEQIHKLGEMTGASYVMIAEAAMLGADNIIITAKVVDVETGKIENSAVMTSSTDASKMSETCDILAKKLLNIYTDNSSALRLESFDEKSRDGNNLTESTTGNYIENSYDLGLSMVYVRGGEFMLGGTEEQGNEAGEDEKPVRKIKVHDFYIGQFEITQSQWATVMGTTIFEQASKAGQPVFKGVGDNYPMYYICWDEACEFCKRLSRITGKHYRLPSEAEWEYAARGGVKAVKNFRFSGSDVISEVGWYDSNSGGSTHEVGQLQSNALDIYDMSGNVWEWCNDKYGKYGTSPNPYGTLYSLRGGSWNFFGKFSRVSCRHSSLHNIRYFNYGFRVVYIP